MRRLQRPSPECSQRCPGVETAYREILAAQDLDPKEALEAIHVAMCSNEEAFRCISGEEDCVQATEALGVESGTKLALQVACSCFLPAICVLGDLGGKTVYI